MNKNKNIIIVGDSAFAEIAYEYFMHDSDYTVKAFSVSQEYLKRDKLFDLPVVPFETIEKQYPPSSCEMFIALTYQSLNRNRAKLYNEAKEKGYTLASYVSSKAFVWPNVVMGDNCFIFEDNTVQPFVKLGSDVILWSGNHIGHHSVIGDHCFISSHVVISGFVHVGDFCFFGVNATVVNNVSIGKDCFIGASAAITHDVAEGRLLKGVSSKPEDISSLEFFKL